MMNGNFPFVVFPFANKRVNDEESQQKGMVKSVPQWILNGNDKQILSRQIILFYFLISKATKQSTT